MAGIDAESGARVRRLGGAAAGGWRRPDRWAPPVSGWEREGRAGAARLGPSWAERGEEREKRRDGPESAQRPRRGNF